MVFSPVFLFRFCPIGVILRLTYYTRIGNRLRDLVAEKTSFSHSSLSFFETLNGRKTCYRKYGSSDGIGWKHSLTGKPPRAIKTKRPGTRIIRIETVRCMICMVAYPKREWSTTRAISFVQVNQPQKRPAFISRFSITSRAIMSLKMLNVNCRFYARKRIPRIPQNCLSQNGKKKI